MRLDPSAWKLRYTMSRPEDLAALSPRSRAVGQLCALFVPDALSVVRLTCLLEEPSLAALPLPAAGALGDAVAELVRVGVAKQAGSGTVAMVPAAALAVLREARAAGTLAALLAAVAGLLQREKQAPALSGQAHQARMDAADRNERTTQLLQRGYLLAGDVQGFEALQTNRRPDFALLAEPFAEEALRAVPPALRQEACKACLRRVIHYCAPAEAVVDACQVIGDSPLASADDVAFVRVLQGNFAAAAEVFDALPGPLRETTAAEVGRASICALAAMLRGEDEAAALAIQQALDVLKGNRKRLVFPEPRAFALSLLALARLDTPASQTLLADIAEAHRWDQPGGSGLALAQRAANVKAKSGSSFYGHRPDGFAGLLDGIAMCWLDAPPDEEALARTRRLRARAEENGFAWVAAECRAVLAHLAPGEGAAADGHAKLGTTTLTTLTVPPGPWEHSLGLIEELAEAPAADEAEDAAEPDGRLLWTLRAGSGHVELEAREQRRGAGGGWTRGKQYGAKRLAAESTRMDFLLPQDEAAIAAAATRQEWNRKASYFGLASLHALAGHPRVQDAKGQPLEVVRREPELSVDQAADGAVVVRATPPRAGTDGAYSVRFPAPGRCEITHFSAAHQRLFRAIPEPGLKLPGSARQRLLKTVPALASRVRVASSLQNVAVEAVRVEADARPWVRLEPRDDGLAVALEVEPIAHAGSCFPPGAGGVVVFASNKGRNLQAERDFDAEAEAVAELVERCPRLAAEPTTLQPLILRGDECLELLEELKAAGARCKWPHGEAMKVVGRAANNALRLSIKSAVQWMQVSGELRVDEERALDLKRLFALVDENRGSRFLPLGGGEYVAVSQSFRRRLEDFAAVATAGAKGAQRLDPLAALAVADVVEGATVEADDGWHALRQRMEAANAFEPELPSTLQAELRSYQLEGFNWLARLAEWGVGACLADDMGLGKTLQALALLLLRAPGGPALVVAPTSVVPNWLAEARRFAPTLAVKRYAGSGPQRAAMLEELGPFDVVLATYGLLQNDVAELTRPTWHTAVLDEAQAIKNPNAKRSQAAKELQAACRVITTGTPVQNNLMDLHSLFGFVNPGLLGSLRQFRARFVVPIERAGDPEAQARLRRLVNPFVLRRLKADVLDDLPSRTEITLHVKMSEEEASLYEAVRQHALGELKGTADGAPMRLFAHLTRLRLACCHPRLVLDSANVPADLPPATTSSKLETFAATLDDLLANRHKVLVFSQFVMHLRLIEDHLRAAGVAYQYLDGSTPTEERTARIAAFQAGTGDVFLISLAAGGVGLNLTAADYVIHMDPWWNPAVEDQASDRAHRIGQTRPVTIYRLVAEGTIEEQIVDLHQRKRDLAQQLLAATDTPSRLDVEEMMALLRQPLAA